MEILQALADTGIRQLAAGGKARAFCDIVSAKLGELDTRQFLNISETLLPFASGMNLDLIGEIYGVYRLGQQIASVPAGDRNLRFYVRRDTFGHINKGKDILIPAGVEITTINDSGPVYLTDPITLKAGDKEAWFSAKSTSPGNAANVTAGVFTRHNSPDIPNPASAACLSPTPSASSAAGTKKTIRASSTASTSRSAAGTGITKPLYVSPFFRYLAFRT